MTVYAADWILPVAGKPLSHGWIRLENGRITEVGSGRRDDAEDLGHVAILPALVNAHTHLELSYLRGEVPEAEGFLEWVRGIMAARRAQPDPEAPGILGAARAALREAFARLPVDDGLPPLPAAVLPSDRSGVVLGSQAFCPGE